MKVIKVLSNSLLMALDDYGQEAILLGKGIGYKKSIGTKLLKSDVEKIFVLRERAVVRDIIRLASEVSENFLPLQKILSRMQWIPTVWSLGNISTSPLRIIWLLQQKE